MLIKWTVERSYSQSQKAR